jgi:hypothetical protein
VEACGLKHAASDLSGLQFVTCIESEEGMRETTKDFDNLLIKCAAKVGLDTKSIQTCVSGTEADDLINQIAKETPEHQYVPWVVANGKHSTEDEKSIESDAYKWACDNFKGTKPSGCTSLKTNFRLGGYQKWNKCFQS